MKDLIDVQELLEDCYIAHDIDCNQKYGEEGNELPYSFHLKMVVAVAKRFIHLIPHHLQDKVLLSCAGHDLIEDARLTYHNIKEAFGIVVADIIYCCTDEKGKNRSERHSEKFYKELFENRYAVFVKLCDVIANSTYSRVMGSSMFKKYQKDLPKMKKLLYIEDEYEELWKELELILS